MTYRDFPTYEGRLVLRPSSASSQGHSKFEGNWFLLVRLDYSLCPKEQYTLFEKPRIRVADLLQNLEKVVWNPVWPGLKGLRSGLGVDKHQGTCTILVINLPLATFHGSSGAS